jgi:serine/threonine protein kinase
MASKISFMSGLASHANIVRFIGSCDTVDEGPVMLLELCDIPLKDWLSQHTSVSVDMLENLLTFILNIARGVEHLHSKHVVHRRLGVRNVLLKMQMNGFVAKLIGFGPMAEDQRDANHTNTEVALPLRWMAPETLDTMKSKNPMYNNKTDAWSYGITVWEMYSQGSKPFPEHESREVRGLLSRGYRMECPKDCPPQIFTSVVSRCWSSLPSERPEFSVVCSTLDSFRKASGVQDRQDYYAVQQDIKYETTMACSAAGDGDHGGRRTPPPPPPCLETQDDNGFLYSEPYST